MEGLEAQRTVLFSKMQSPLEPMDKWLVEEVLVGQVATINSSFRTEGLVLVWFLMSMELLRLVNQEEADSRVPLETRVKLVLPRSGECSPVIGSRVIIQQSLR